MRKRETRVRNTEPPKREKAPKLRERLLREIFPPIDPHTERGEAILHAARLDDLLASLLQEFFIDDKSVSNKLLSGFNAPLQNFSVRIDTAYALGLISENERHNLTIINKVRRDFAHTTEHKRSFATREIRDRCRELKLPSEFTRLVRADWDSPNVKFTGTFFFLLVNFMARRAELEHQKARRKKAELIPMVRVDPAFTTLAPTFESVLNEPKRRIE